VKPDNARREGQMAARQGQQRVKEEEPTTAAGGKAIAREKKKGGRKRLLYLPSPGESTNVRRIHGEEVRI